ncbi:hypothetical protein LCGC14_2610080 [marine sediment metagenome]|uniref:Phosphohydrolase n=1 Tax=marine sediment metagenome TaxID=412755 RepID=A0A0F9CH65_9ZZZZ
MTWFQTRSGQVFDFEDPSPDAINIEDIAHALSKQCRFNGHCTEFYSVAQHSCYVCDIITGSKAGQLTALLHDAAEAYTGDMVAPLKYMLPDFRRIEKRVESAVFEKFFSRESLMERLDAVDEIKRADLIMLATEKRDLMEPCWKEWEVLEGVEPLKDRIEGWSVETARREFMSRFRRLQ